MAKAAVTFKNVAEPWFRTMKRKCICGELIRDQTDNLPNKAHVIGDKTYFDFLDVIDEAIESKAEDREALCMHVRYADPSRRAWECLSCGRVYFDDANGNLFAYRPENGKSNRIFDRPRPRERD